MAISKFEQVIKSCCCWGPLPSIKTSISARVMYLIILGGQILWEVLTRELVALTYYACEKREWMNNYCDVEDHFIGVYLLGGMFSLWFAIFAVAHIAVHSSRDIRSCFHYGYWILKMALIFMSDLYAIASGGESTEGNKTLNIYSSQRLLIFLGYACTLVMIVLDFVALWKIVHVVTVILLKRFTDGRSMIAGMILIFLGVNLFMLPLILGIIALYFFDSNTVRNEIFWAHLFVSYALGLIYSVYYLFKNRTRVLLGGVFIIHVVFTTFIAMFHDNYELYKSYDYTHTIYYTLHVIEILLALMAFVFFVVWGLDTKPLNMVDMLVIYEEIQSDCCCNVKKTEVGAMAPPEVEGVYRRRAYVVTNVPNNDEYTKVKYRWEWFYLLCLLINMYICVAIVDWYEIPRKEMPEDIPPFHNEVIQWIKFVGVWITTIVFIVFMFKPVIWEENLSPTPYADSQIQQQLQAQFEFQPRPGATPGPQAPPPPSSPSASPYPRLGPSQAPPPPSSPYPRQGPQPQFYPPPPGPQTWPPTQPYPQAAPYPYPQGPPTPWPQAPPPGWPQGQPPPFPQGPPQPWPPGQPPPPPWSPGQPPPQPWPPGQPPPPPPYPQGPPPTPPPYPRQG